MLIQPTTGNNVVELRIIDMFNTFVSYHDQARDLLNSDLLVFLRFFGGIFRRCVLSRFVLLGKFRHFLRFGAPRVFPAALWVHGGVKGSR